MPKPWFYHGFGLRNIGFTMVLAFETLVLHRKTKVLYWSLLVFVTRVFDIILVILGSHLLLDWFYNGIGQNALLPATVVPLSGKLWRRWREQPRNAPDAPELQKVYK